VRHEVEVVPAVLVVVHVELRASNRRDHVFHRRPALLQVERDLADARAH